MKQKNKGKKIIVLFIIILAICTLSYAYITTDILKTPEQLFFKYFAKNITQLDEMNIAPYNEVLEDFVTENSETKVKIDYEGVSEGLLFSKKRNINTTADFKNDINNNKQSLEIEVLSDGDKFLNLEVLTNEEIVGIKCEGLYEKYLALENNNLQEFFYGKFGLTEDTVKLIPNKIGISKVREFNEKEEKEAEKLQKKYIKEVLNLLKTGAFSSEKNVEIESISEKSITKKQALKIKQKDLYVGLSNILNELLMDENFLKLYKERITESNLEELKKSNEDFLKKAEAINPEKEVEIHVYSVNGKTIRTDFVIGIEKYSYQTLNKENETTIKFNVAKEKSSDNLVASESNIIIKNTVTNEKKSELDFNYTLVYDSSDKLALDKKAQNLYGYNNFYDETFKNEEMDLKVTIDASNENNVNLNIKSDKLKDYDINCNIIFKDNIVIKEINRENALVLTNYTDKELNSLGQEILLNLIKSAAFRPNSLIGSISGLFMPLFTNQNAENNIIDTNIPDTNQNSTDYYSEDVNSENTVNIDSNNGNLKNNSNSEGSDTLNQITTNILDKKEDIINKTENVIDGAKNFVSDTMNVIETIVTH